MLNLLTNFAPDNVPWYFSPGHGVIIGILGLYSPRKNQNISTQQPASHGTTAITSRDVGGYDFISRQLVMPRDANPHVSSTNTEIKLYFVQCAQICELHVILFQELYFLTMFFGVLHMLLLLSQIPRLRSLSRSTSRSFTVVDTETL